MTNTYTTTETFTRTNARYLASKVAADLRQMQRFYGHPSDGEIDEYVEELVELLVNSYLSSIDYGFRKNNEWIVALSYTVTAAGMLATDDRSGRIQAGVNVSGATWGSYLRKSNLFFSLPAADRARIEQSLPIKRTNTDEPLSGNGQWVTDKTYSSGGQELSRRTFRPY